MPYADSNGIKLYYEERGSGDPLLLIMGITAPGSVWEEHVSFWEKEFHCILFDNRGVGQSDKPEGPYTSEQMADDASGLLRSLQIPEANVAGVSMGSIIAQQLAIRHSDQVRSLVLMCPWARCDHRTEAVFRHLMHIKAHLRPEQFQHFIQYLIFDRSSWDNEEQRVEFEEGQQAASTNPNPQPLHGLEGQAEACIRHDVLNQLPSISQPALVIGGEEDRFVPAWMVREVAEQIPNSSLHLYEDAGHAFHWEQLDDFNSRVLDWLKGLDS
ncbi:MAG: alpha/beta hydrolase [Balneolaceae bacterium]